MKKKKSRDFQPASLSSRQKSLSLEGNSERKKIYTNQKTKIQGVALVSQNNEGKTEI